MFSFFTKKKFLVDYLEGFVDIHNHILPGIDDGAKNVGESIELIKGFGEFGVTNFICTPHIMENYYPNNPDSIHKSLTELKNGLHQKGLSNITIEAAAEHMIDSNFEKLLENDEFMPLSKQYILIEMSYLQIAMNFEAAVKRIKEKQRFPILAHPERYSYFHQNLRKYETYKNKGLLFQLNLLSLSDYYGKEVQKLAFILIESSQIDFIASDVHKINQLEKMKQITLKSSHLDIMKKLIEKTTYNFK